MATFPKSDRYAWEVLSRNEQYREDFRVLKQIRDGTVREFLRETSPPREPLEDHLKNLIVTEEDRIGKLVSPPGGRVGYDWELSLPHTISKLYDECCGFHRRILSELFALDGQVVDPDLPYRGQKFLRDPAIHQPRPSNVDDVPAGPWRYAHFLVDLRAADQEITRMLKKCLADERAHRGVKSSRPTRHPEGMTEDRAWKVRLECYDSQSLNGSMLPDAAVLELGKKYFKDHYQRWALAKGTDEKRNFMRRLRSRIWDFVKVARFAVDASYNRPTFRFPGWRPPDLSDDRPTPNQLEDLIRDFISLIRSKGHE